MRALPQTGGKGPIPRYSRSARVFWQTAPMGPALIVIVLVVVIPVLVLLSASIAAAVLGYWVKTDVDQENEGSELIALNN